MFEKKRGKRFLASVMALVMLLSLAPVGALAAKGGNDNESYVTQDTFNIKGNVTYYALSGESPNNFTEARYIWEKDNTVYLAFIISYGQGNDKPIQSATASTKQLNVGTILYTNLKFGSEDPISATGKKGEYARWQIATYEGSIQSLLNTGNTLTIYADTGAGGYNLKNVSYTVENYSTQVTVTYNANFEGATISYNVPADISVAKDTQISVSKWTKDSAEVEDSVVTATKDGETYAFKGWSITQSGSAEGSILHALDTLQVTKNTTLYAIWEEQKVTPEPDPKPDSTDVYVYFQTQNTKGEPVDISGTSIQYNNHSWATLGKISTTQTLTSDTEYTGTNNILAAVGKQAKTDLNGEALHPNNKDIAAKVLSSITWVFLKEWSGADGYQPAEVKCWHLDGKLTVYGVTYLPGVEDESEVTNMPENTQTYYLKDTPYTVSSVVPQRDGCTFAGWKSSNSNDNTVYTAGSTMTMPGEDVTLTAMWEENKTPVTPTKPTKAIDAKYFVLIPGRGTPVSGADQGTSYYLPNETNNGGITGLTYLTGYTGGGLTAAGQAAADASYTDIDSMNGVFNRTGINASYLVVPTDLGYFTVGNWTEEGVYSPTSTSKAALSNVLGENFNTKNISIIWYSLKKQFREGSVVYHVDGYVKDIPVTLTYHDNFTGSSDSYTQNGLKSGEKAPIAQNGTVSGSNSGSKTFSHEGYEFKGWYDNAACIGTNYAGQTHTMMDNLNLYAKWEKIYTVTFNTGDNGTLGGNLTQTGVSGTTLTEPTKTPSNGFEFAGWVKDGVPVTLPTTITKDATYTATWKPAEVPPTTAKYTVNHYKWDVANKNYLLDESKELEDNVAKEVTATVKTYQDYTLNTQASILKGTVKADNQLTLNLYYDIDKIGGGENKDQPDGIPDRYQVTINYVSSNTNWGTVNRSKEVITLINKESGNWAETGTVIAPSCTATSAGGRCYFVNWTKKQEGSTASSTVISSANLPAQTIENAKGGDVYTFTANFDRSSGGSGGGSRPTVTIPDDVPTGLNGTDHYAYIIGYGNNDVRPQNNITRAEVATIFFRLLTDETRTANMTKSNSYNDVKDGDWFCCAVSTLSKMGIIKGYEDGSFKPNDPISRAEFAAIAARFDPDGDKTPATFADVTSHWAKDEISIAANHGWIKGYEDGSFKPDQKITRAETMTLVNRVLNRLPETKDDLHKDMKTWVDNMDETAWYYLAVQEATNSHYFKNKTSTKFEQWTDLRDTRDWSELEK